MKEFLTNLAIAIVAVILVVLVDLWAILFSILAGIPTVIAYIFVQSKRDKMYSWYKETIVLPFKWMGICNSWDEYISWVRFNL